MATMLNQAKQKVLALRKTGSGVIKITHFCVGTATPYTPSPTQTDLINRINIGSANKKAITEYTNPDSMTLRFKCLISESECVGENITELGLIDSAGDVVCVKSFPPKAKTDEREMIFYIDDTWRTE